MKNMKKKYVRPVINVDVDMESEVILLSSSITQETLPEEEKDNVIVGGRDGFSDWDD